MSQAPAQRKESPETVLLRQPLPRYNFQGRKLPKESPVNKSTTQGTGISPQASQASDTSTSTSPGPSVSSSATPTGLAGSVMHQPGSDTTAPPSGLDRKSAAVRPFSASLKSAAHTSATDRGATRPISAVVAPNFRSGGQGREVKRDVEETAKGSGAGPAAVGSSRGGAWMTYLPGPVAINFESNGKG